MLGPLQKAVVALLQGALPSVFPGADGAAVSFSDHSWAVDPVSADPVAGEPGPQDAIDDLPFLPATPAGPYQLSRLAYPGPRRVYLKSADGELQALGPSEVGWDAAVAGKFSLALRPDRNPAAASVEVLYTVVAAGTQLKALHKANLQIDAATSEQADRASALALAVLLLNRDSLMAAASFSWQANGYQAQVTTKSLQFNGGASSTESRRSLAMVAELELRLDRIMGGDEGAPIQQILSANKTSSSKSLDIDPAIQA